MLDAPVSGETLGAINATLSIMVGGDRDIFDACLPVFEAMGTNINLIGPNGAGQTTKLCNQIAAAGANLAMAEALMLAATSDLDVGKVIEAISGGAAGSWQLSNLGPRVIKGDFAPGFMVHLQQKDSSWSCRLPTTSSWRFPAPVLPISILTLLNVLDVLKKAHRRL